MATARRDALRAFGALAILPVFSLAAKASANSVGRVIAPPSTPMWFTRKLRRNLSDGKAIIVTRTWRVEFTPVGNDYALSGTQVAVDVEAPPALAGLARLEERKTESGLFPIMLGGDGLISNEALAASKPAVDQAVALAEKRLEGQ